jgi:hypothetical protein
MAFNTFNMVGDSNGSREQRQYPAEGYDLSFTPKLNGTWLLREQPQSSRDYKAADYTSHISSKLIGKLFPGGIHTVQEQNIAEMLAGMKPELIKPVGCKDIRNLGDDKFELLCQGEHPCSRLQNSGDLETLRKLRAEIVAFDAANPVKAGEYKSQPPAEWLTACSKVLVVVRPYGCTIPESFYDRDMIAFDAQRIAKREAAAKKQPNAAAHAASVA